MCTVASGHAEYSLARELFKEFVKEESLSRYGGMEQVQKDDRDDSAQEIIRLTRTG